MFFWAKHLKSFLQSIHDDVSPNEVAGAFALGAAIGLLPKGNLTTLILFLITWVIRVNIGVAFAAITLFAILGHLTDPLVEKIGFHLLTFPALHGLWTVFYNAPLLPFLGFNNTLVMGNLVLAVILVFPVFIAIRALVLSYRVRYREHIARWRIIQALKATHFYSLYDRWLRRP